MNYSNMIEEKALKKTFIIATLVSTIVGTFTASIALHDKIKEKQEKAANAKKQQQGVDDKQDNGIEELKARLGELENKADKGKEETVKDQKPSKSRSRSRSSDRSRASSRRSRARSRASRRDSPMENDNFAQAADKSKAMLEETYEQNVGQLGQDYAQGDLITENALQKQVIDLQQVVINVLQGAVTDNRALTEDDMRQIIIAQDKARDGSISALNAQRDRLLAEQQRKEHGEKPWDRIPPPPAAPPPRGEPMKALPPAETPQPKPWERQPSDRRSVYEREPVLAQASRRNSYRPAPPPSNAREVYSDPFAPPPSRKASKEKYEDLFAPPPSERKREKYPDPFAVPSANRPKESYPDPFAAPPSDKREGEKHPDPFAAATIGAGVATAAATVAATVKSNAHRDDPPRRSQSARGDVPRGVPSQKGAPSRILPDEPEWRPPPPPMGKGAPDDGRSRAPSRAMSVRGPPPPSNWNSPPKSRRNSLAPPARAQTVPSKAWDQPDRPQKANSDPVKSVRAQSVAPPRPPESPIRPLVNQSPPLSQRSARGSPPPGPKTIKSLPAPPPPLFCRYAKDLQRDPSRPLDKAFSRSGTHACPACHIPIPVDTRDVWVLSTHFPKSSSKSDKVKNRDYRMDARFVVKCHTADGRAHFACVLCDKWRDIDCICRDVDALVKHLGTAHTPDEFEKDGDLVRMKDGSVVKSSTGREMALA